MRLNTSFRPIDIKVEHIHFVLLQPAFSLVCIHPRKWKIVHLQPVCGYCLCDLYHMDFYVALLLLLLLCLHFSFSGADGNIRVSTAVENKITAEFNIS